MARQYNDQGTIRQYLLGQLTGDNQQKVEERLLIEADLLEELEIDEDELIDEYLTQKLNAEERDCFERHFMATAEREQKLRFARALKRYVTASAPQEIPPPPASSALWNNKNWALRAVAAIAVVGIIAGIVWYSRQRTPSPQTFATYTLNISSGTRGNGPQSTKIPLPLNVDVVRLRLMLPELSSGTTRYRVELLGAKGETQTLKTVGQDEQSVVVEVPATQLSRGQYALRVYATKGEGTEQRVRDSYLFTVE